MPALYDRPSVIGFGAFKGTFLAFPSSGVGAALFLRNLRLGFT